MKIFTTFLFFIFHVSIGNAQSLYVKTFGENKAQPIIFLHGGPGYNSVNFEATTAQKLAEKGFFVVVYDRRGEGRSEDKNAKFTFDETLGDISNICDSLGLEKVHLFGHSFGGVVATRFAMRYPEKVHSIFLVAAPLSFQEIFKNVVETCKEIYSNKNDSVNLRYIAMLEKMDTSSIQYSSYCFAHAMQNGFYVPKAPTEKARDMYKTFTTDALLVKYASQMSYQAPQGFWKNEQYTTIDLREELQHLKNSDVPIFGLYGQDDGLYSQEQVESIQRIIGTENLEYFPHCSHNVFIDQQELLIEKVVEWIE